MDYIVFQIHIYEKNDIDWFIDMIKAQNIDNPVYIIEMKDSFRIDFTSDYEHSEIELLMSDKFPEFEFTEDIGNGKNEIFLKICRSKLPYSTDSWGRQFNSETIESKLYFVKKKGKNESPNSKLLVLFGDNEKEYVVNIAEVTSNERKENGFLVVKKILNKYSMDDVLINIFFKDFDTAFWNGYHKLSYDVEEDYKEYKRNQKKRRKK